MWLCQETGWGWLRKVGVSATAGETRLRLRRGYEEPTSKVRRETEAGLVCRSVSVGQPLVGGSTAVAGWRHAMREAGVECRYAALICVWE